MWPSGMRKVFSPRNDDPRRWRADPDEPVLAMGLAQDEVDPKVADPAGLAAARGNDGDAQATTSGRQRLLKSPRGEE